MKSNTYMDEFNMPRWENLPEIDLYMDQLISLLEKKLSCLSHNDDDKQITSTMINNYVKQKVILPPIKKKYSREHLSKLFVIFILKRVFSISEICLLIERFTDNYTVEVAYNMFCDAIEAAHKRVFSGENVEGLENCDTALKSAALAYAYKLYTQKLL